MHSSIRFCTECIYSEGLLIILQLVSVICWYAVEVNTENMFDILKHANCRTIHYNYMCNSIYDNMYIFIASHVIFVKY